MGKGGLNPSNLTAVGNTLYFSGGDSHGVQLWKSHGSVSGTTIITTSNDGVPNFGVYPSDMINVGGTLYFTGLDLKKGTQIFTSNGTVPVAAYRRRWRTRTTAPRAMAGASKVRLLGSGIVNDPT